LVGDIGRDPSFRTTEKGADLRFPLGVHDAERTIWHNVYTTKQFAQRYQDQPKRGQQVEVIGQRQEQQQPQPDGATTTTAYG